MNRAARDRELAASSLRLDEPVPGTYIPTAAGRASGETAVSPWTQGRKAKNMQKRLWTSFGMSLLLLSLAVVPLRAADHEHHAGYGQQGAAEPGEERG